MRISKTWMWVIVGAVVVVILALSGTTAWALTRDTASRDMRGSTLADGRGANQGQAGGMMRQGTNGRMGQRETQNNGDNAIQGMQQRMQRMMGQSEGNMLERWQAWISQNGTKMTAADQATANQLLAKLKAQLGSSTQNLSDLRTTMQDLRQLAAKYGLAGPGTTGSTSGTGVTGNAGTTGTAGTGSLR